MDIKSDRNIYLGKDGAPTRTAYLKSNHSEGAYITTPLQILTSIPACRLTQYMRPVNARCFAKCVTDVDQMWTNNKAPVWATPPPLGNYTWALPDIGLSAVLTR